ncbi:MAG: hypothetical protein VB980_00185 [Opitutales bacterium]
MNEPISVAKIVLASLVFLFVTLAMGQVVIFDLKKDTKKNLLVHKGIACLGMGAAFYALFLSRLHFSVLGWGILSGGVVAIVFVGSMIHNYMKETGLKSGLEYKKTKASPKRIKAAEETKRTKEMPAFVFEWVGGFFVLFWILVLLSPLWWHFLGDERSYQDMVSSSWSSFLSWFANSE